MTRCADYGHAKLLIWQNLLFGTSKGQNDDKDNQLSPMGHFCILLRSGGFCNDEVAVTV